MPASIRDPQNWTTERIARLAALVLLIVACLQIILPFVGALTWAAIIAITIWPAFGWLSTRLGHRPVLAATLCSLALFVILVMPFAVLTSSLGQAVPQLSEMLRGFTVSIAPVPPEWVVALPLVGELIAETWQSAVTDMSGLVSRALPAAEEAGVWALAQGASLALAILEFLLAILVAGVLLVTADRSADVAQRIASRLDIGEGARIIGIVVNTVRSVSLGVVGTAVIQSGVATIGYVIAGLPGIPLLGFATFMLCLIQLPTIIVWLPAAIWLWTQDQTGSAIFLLVYGGLLVNWVDNIVRPYLISRGAKLPFALILIGVLGGLFAWGIIGLFIGPTVLAVAYSLVRTWIGKADPATPDPTAS